MEQIMRADRAAFGKIAEKISTLKRDSSGELPMDKELANLESDSSINFHVLPVPNGKIKKNPPAIKPAKPDKIKKGKGKGKGKSPKELIGLSHNTDGRERICFNFNLAHGCSQKLGRHVNVENTYACSVLRITRNMPARMMLSDYRHQASPMVPLTLPRRSF